MKTLNNRIIKIEKRLYGENGIAAWAMREAELRAKMEPSMIRGTIALNKAMRAAGLEVEDDTPVLRFVGLLGHGDDRHPSRARLFTRQVAHAWGTAPKNRWSTDSTNAMMRRMSM